MLNEDFNIDQFKKSWQEQPVSDVYNTSEIEGMLNKKSTNYVKYIFWISLAEFLFFAIVGICTIFSTQRSNSFTNILEKLGVQMNDDVEMNFEHLYFALKVFSLLITAIFVFLFYRNYLKIKVECNLKNFILQIIKFKRTVNLFIFTNIGLLIVFSGIITYLQNCLRNYYEQTEQKSRAIAKNRTGTINNKKPSALLKVFFIIILFSILRLEY